MCDIRPRGNRARLLALAFVIFHAKASNFLPGRAGKGNQMDGNLPDAFEISGQDRPGPWLITCDHASNHVPDWVNGGDLGIGAEDMARHIAYDVGAAGLSRYLGEVLNGPVIESRFSRLVIDANRGEADPTLLMRLCDGTIIPANRHAGPEDLHTRLERLYRPYHSAYADLAARNDETVIVAVHSFTPCLRGRPPRPWHVGVLYSPLDDRLSRSLLRQLAAEPDLCIGENEPYAGHLPGDAVDRHALQKGRHNVLIELRNDLIVTAAQQQAWAKRLAPLLVRALSEVLA
jgi:predicted N-formylglutamate amidohydrolase